ncbi:MAG: thioredoxin family protein [Gammaproteobacteria bacterium]|nr:thioredoxin family protein [Gammaproteobacteria bacterium]
MSETTQISPGQTFWVGLALTPSEDWHTYWRNPGDAGKATSIEWSLPAQFTASAIHWPAPSRLPSEPVVSFGYPADVLLPVQITVPADLQTDTVTLKAHARWLVCKDVCIPEQAELILTLRVGKQGQPTADAALILDALHQTPLEATVSSEFGSSHATPDAGDHVGSQIDLRISADAQLLNNITAAFFFPYASDIINNAAAQPLTIGKSHLGLVIPTLPTVAEDLLNKQRDARDLAGVVVIETGTGRAAWAINPTLNTALPPLVAITTTANSLSLFEALLFAFLGGLILNLMPCVLPVLSLKALAIARKSGAERAAIRAQGWVFAAGVIISFLIVAGALLVIKAAGAQIGWGFHLQNPLVIGVLIYVLFLVALNLSGVFEVGAGLQGVGQKFAHNNSAWGTFFTGVLAVMVATPCTAPFMAPALGFALTQPMGIALAVFLALGIGFALPLWLVCQIPAAQRLLPKPGAWMDTFKQLLAFPMYLAAIWLIWVLGRQSGPNAIGIILLGCLALGFATWVMTKQWKTFLRISFMVLAIVAAVMALHSVSKTSGLEHATSSNTAHAGIETEPYTPARLADLRAAHQPVFVNMTADWCITCMVNEKVAFTNNANKIFVEKNITYLIGDWTNYDPAITAYLAEFKRSGVPLYVYYDANDNVTVLPQILTERILLDALGQ